MIFHVARNGTLTGQYDEGVFRSKLRTGEIKSTDHYFTEGSTDWKPVYEYRFRAKTEPIQHSPPIKPPAVPHVASSKAGVPRKPRTPAATGAILAVGAVFAPLLWQPFFVVISLPLLIAAFVLAIVAIVKGQVTGGIALLIGLFFAALMAFDVMIDRDKILNHQPPYSNSR